MSITARASFKGGSAGTLRPRVLSTKVAGMLPVIQEAKLKPDFNIGLHNDKLKQIKTFETKRKL